MDFFFHKSRSAVEIEVCRTMDKDRHKAMKREINKKCCLKRQTCEYFIFSFLQSRGVEEELNKW